MINYDTSLRKFITKCDRSLFKNASGFLLQNATVLLQNGQLLQNVMFITNYDSTITIIILAHNFETQNGRLVST